MTGNFSRNAINNNLVDGLFVNGSTDSTATFEVVSNTTDGNGFEGIHFERFEAAQVTFNSNTSDNNGRHGIYLSDYLTPGGQIDIVSSSASNNSGQGILVERGDGNLNILNSTVINNVAGGIKTESWTNMTAGQRTFIGNTVGGITNISGNGVGAGANLQFDLFAPGVTQDILVTGLSLNDGGRGVFSTVDGENSVLNIDIVNMISISNNIADGIRLVANNGGTINTQIGNTTDTPLQLIDNGAAAGAGIFLTAEGPGGTVPSRINAAIDNVNIQLAPSTFNVNGVDISSLDNAVVDVSITNSTITKSEVLVPEIGELRGGDIAINMNFANDGSGNINRVFTEGKHVAG